MSNSGGAAVDQQIVTHHAEELPSADSSRRDGGLIIEKMRDLIQACIDYQKRRGKNCSNSTADVAQIITDMFMKSPVDVKEKSMASVQ